MSSQLIKKPNLEEGFTEHQLLELARCARPGISEDYGVVYFAKTYVKIQHPTLGEVPFELRDYQIKIIKCYQNNRWSVVLTSRQSGKTEATCLWLLFVAMFKPDQKILVASRIGADASDIMKRIRRSYESVPDFLRPGVTVWNVRSVEFDNGSEIFACATTEDTGRGRSISLLYIDEMARIRPSIAEEFWSSISPTLTSGGACIVTSTANTSSDIYSSIYFGAINGSKNGFKAVTVSWQEVPEPDGSKRGEQFRLDTISRIGELKWRREYNNEFLSDSESLISALQMENWKPIDHITKKNNFKFWESPKSDQMYVIGVDVGTGTGGDYSTIECFTFPQLVQVAELCENTLSTNQLTMRLIWLLKAIDKAGGTPFYSVESNGVGEGILSAIEQIEDDKNIEIPGTMFHDSGKGKRGYYTSNKTKLKGCMNLKQMLDTTSSKMTIKSLALQTEFKYYIRSGASFAAVIGMTDDLIAAMIIMSRVMEDVVQYEDIDFDLMYEDDDILDDDDTDFYDIVF